MADGWKSSWGSSGSSDPFIKIHPIKTPHRPSGVGGFLHNTIKDVTAFATGLGPALIELGKSTGELAMGNPSGFEHLGAGMINQWKYTYGSGNFNTIMHRVYEHPLGPIMDAVSIATLPFAGAGAAIKGLDTLGELGVRMGVVDAQGAGKLALRNAANRFRHDTPYTTRQLDVPGAPSDIYLRYSTNPLNRTIQKGMHQAGFALGARYPKYFGNKGAIRRLTPTGRANKIIEMGRSRRAVATIKMGERQGKAIGRLHKIGYGPQQIVDEIAPHVYNVMTQTAERVSEDKLIWNYAGEGKAKIRLYHGLPGAPKQNMVRLYRSKPGDTYFTPDVEYARSYAGEGHVEYVDMPIKKYKRNADSTGFINLPEARGRKLTDNTRGLKEPKAPKSPYGTAQYFTPNKEYALSQAEGRDIYYTDMSEQAYAKAKDNAGFVQLSKKAVNRAKPLTPAADMPRPSGTIGRPKLHEGFQFVRAEQYFKAPTLSGVAPHQVETWFNSMAKELTTTNARNAARDADGNYLIVRRKTKEDMLRAGIDTSKALYHFYTNPTKVWKWMILATPPRYFINNVFGNSLMLSMATNPVDTVRGMYHTTRQLYGERAARRSMSSVDKALQRINGDWVDKYFLNTSSYAQDIGNQLYSPKTKAGKLLVRGPLYGVTHFWSDSILRRIFLNSAIKHNPRYAEAYNGFRMSGMSNYAAHNEAALKLAENPSVRDSLLTQSDNILGQYHYYNRAERAVKTVAPFYGWYRAIMRHAWVQATERPVMADMYVKAGETGNEDLKKMLGEHLPDFLLTSIPLKMLGLGKLNVGGRIPVLNTTGLNPYSTIPEIVGAAGSLAGVPGTHPNEDVASLVNPIATGAVEYVTGTSLLTGAPVKKQPGGIVGNIAYSVGRQTPYSKLIQTAVSGPPKPKPGQELLYTGDLHQQVTSILGFPQKMLSPTKATQLWAREEGQPLPKKIKIKQASDKTNPFKTKRSTTRIRKVTPHKYSVRRPSTRAKGLPHISLTGRHHVHKPPAPKFRTRRPAYSPFIKAHHDKPTMGLGRPGRKRKKKILTLNVNEHMRVRKFHI